MTMELSYAAAWSEYEARNRRAAVEYAVRPSIAADIIASLEEIGLSKTARHFNTMPAALYAWFPDLIARCDGGDRFSLTALPA